MFKVFENKGNLPTIFNKICNNGKNTWMVKIRNYNPTKTTNPTLRLVRTGRKW